MELPSSKDVTAFPHNSVQTTIDNIEDIKYKQTYLSLARKVDAGGECQKGWVSVCSRNSESQQFYENDLRRSLLPHEGGKVTEYYEKLQDKFSRFNCPITLDPKISTFDDVALHALLRQRLSPSTVEKRMRYARFMETHEVPVDFRNPNFENFIKHMDYREQVEFGDDCGRTALQHEWKTMKLFLKAFGINQTEWPYVPPSIPKSKARYIPLPDTVYKMVRKDYSMPSDKKRNYPDGYVSALIQYSLLHSFMMGWRNPSEIIVLSVDDIDFQQGTMIITEPKKHYSTRVIVPEYSILDGKNRKSFKYWIDVWRHKVETSKSGDAVYLNPEDGSPLNPDSYRRLIERRVKPHFPKFTLYATRHWCAIARLIRSKKNTGTWDTFDVRNWLGHSDIKTTVGYLRDAEQYFKLAPYDWFQRVLKFQNYNNKKMEEENAVKNSTRQKKRVLSDFSPRERDGPAEI